MLRIVSNESFSQRKKVGVNDGFGKVVSQLRGKAEKMSPV